MELFLDHIRKDPFHSPEIKETGYQQQEDHGRREAKQRPVNGLMAQDRGPICINDPAHGIQGEQPLVFLLYHAHRIDNGADEHPQLDKEWYHVPDVSILDVKCG